MLALIRSPVGITFAVADAWEVRSAAETRCQEVSLGPSILRIARREKPTALVVADRSLLRPATHAGIRLRVPLVTQDLPRLPLKIACDMYPELPMRAPTLRLAQAASLAIATVLYAQAPSRHYAPRHPAPHRHPDEHAA